MRTWSTFRWSVVLSAAALGLYGLVRLTFSTVSVRLFGPEFLGAASVALSWQTMVGVLWGAVPAMFVSKFVSEAIGGNRDDVARRLLGGALVVALFLGCAVGVVSVIVAGTSAGPLAIYGGAFGTYLVFRASFLAVGKRRVYFLAELAGALGFFGLFATACLLRRPDLAVLALLAHPLTCATVGVVSLWDDWELKGVAAAFAETPRTHASFAAATTVNAAAALGGYHLAVVIAGYTLGSPGQVGYLSAIMATLSPLNLIPQALGTVLFPEVARRFGSGDTAGRNALILRSTSALALVAIIPFGCLVIFPEIAQAIAGAPGERIVRVTTVLLTASTLIAMCSSPSGHLLNATQHVVPHSILAVICLIVAAAVGGKAMLAYGLVGAGLLRLVADGALGALRIGMAESAHGWMAEHRRSFVLAGIAVVLLMGAGLAVESIAARAVAYAFVVGGVGGLIRRSWVVLSTVSRAP